MIIFQDNSLTVFQSALFQTTTSVVRGREFVLVADPTWLPSEISEITEYVHSVRDGRDLYLLFTHSDFDHILGYGAFPTAKTIASREFVDNPNKERCVQDVLAWDSEYYIRRPYAVRYPEIDIAVDRDEQELMLGETRLTFFLAPGHTPDGLITVVQPHGFLIAGDYLSDIEFPCISDSSTAYEETLEKLDDLLGRDAMAMLIPGHGQITADPQEMRERQRRSQGYIRDLRRHLASGDQVGIDAMLDEYPFPLGMKAFHAANQRVMRTEALPAAPTPIPVA